MSIDPAITTSFGFGLAALLAAGAAHKLAHPARFFAVIADYRLAPAAFAPLIGAVVILVEGLVATGLAVPAWRSLAAISCAGLMLAYAGAIAVNILRGRTLIDCGCSFGEAEQGARLTPWLIVRNGVLAAAALVAAAAPAQRALTLVDVITVGLFVVGAGALYAAFEILLAQPARMR